MKTFNLTLLTLLFFFCSLNLFAQNPPYSLVTITDTYANLENATEVTTVGDTWDDPDFIFPLGFDFEFLGETGNTIVMSDFFLGGAVGFPPTFSGESKVLFAHFADIMDRENVDSTLQSSISYKTDGEPGEQIFKLEWKDVGFYNEIDGFGTANNIMNFQLWIYEGSNNFDVRFGPSTFDDNTEFLYELEGPTCGVMDSLVLDTDQFKVFWHLAGDPQKPILNNTEDVASLYTASMLTDNPMDGMVYQFINPLSATENFVKTNAMKVYPSLVTNQFFVEVKDEILSEKTTLSINDQLGRPILNNTITDIKTELSLGHLPLGFYYATIFNKNGIGTVKIVKVD